MIISKTLPNYMMIEHGILGNYSPVIGFKLKLFGSEISIHKFSTEEIAMFYNNVFIFYTFNNAFTY